MRAAYIQQTGEPEVIQVGELPTPTPVGAEVLVRVGAAALNPIDTYLRSGMVPAALPFPFVIGCDLAGTVEAVGPEAKRFKAGDRVWGSNQGLAGRQGTFAEFAAVDEQWLYPTPENVSDENAAALALVGLTASMGLIRDGGVQRGEVVYVSGGTGGVGSIVVQLARIAGARAVTTAGSEAKAELARGFGAERVINYKTEALYPQVRAFAPGGINVWFETLSGPNFEELLPLMAHRGRVIVMAGRKAVSPLPIGPLYTADRKIFGFSMFNSPAQEQRALAEDLNRWHAAGALRANIGKVFTLEEAAAAHRLQEDNTLHKAGTLTGKIIIKP